jgi:hypothetical protein
MVNMDRRGFLQSAAALTATADRPAKAFVTATQKMIGIRVGAVSVADEGTERMLDEFQQHALINTLFWRPSPMGAASPDDSYPVNRCPITAN